VRLPDVETDDPVDCLEGSLGGADQCSYKNYPQNDGRIIGTISRTGFPGQALITANPFGLAHADWTNKNFADRLALVGAWNDRGVSTPGSRTYRYLRANETSHSLGLLRPPLPGKIWLATQTSSSGPALRNVQLRLRINVRPAKKSAGLGASRADRGGSATVGFLVWTFYFGIGKGLRIKRCSCAVIVTSNRLASGTACSTSIHPGLGSSTPAFAVCMEY